MYTYDLQFEQAPSAVYAGFYNESPFFIGLTTTNPDVENFRVNFFAQNSNSSPYQIPQNKWSHLVPQWKFANWKGDYIDYETPTFSTSSASVTADTILSTIDTVLTLSGFGTTDVNGEYSYVGDVWNGDSPLWYNGTYYIYRYSDTNPWIINTWGQIILGRGIPIEIFYESTTVTDHPKTATFIVGVDGTGPVGTIVESSELGSESQTTPLGETGFQITQLNSVLAITNAVSGFTYDLSASETPLITETDNFLLTTVYASADGLIPFFATPPIQNNVFINKGLSPTLEYFWVGFNQNSPSIEATYILETSAYYVDDLPSNVTLIATLETSGLSLTADNVEVELPSYSNSLIYDDLEYQVLSAELNHLEVTQDGKNPIDHFKWVDTLVPFVVTFHPSSALATNIYGLTSVDPILFSVDGYDDTSRIRTLSLAVSNIPNSSLIWNDASSVYLSAYDDYGFETGGFYKGYFTPEVSSVPAKITVDVITDKTLTLSGWGTSAVNGDYEWVSETSGYPRYEKAALVLVHSIGSWFIIDTTSGSQVRYQALASLDSPTDPTAEMTWVELLGTLPIGLVSTTTLLSAESNEFNIKALERPYEMRRFNESWDAGDVIKSFALAEHTFANSVFFDNFMEVSVGGVGADHQSLGRRMYERIANFTENNNDIDVSNVDQFYSLLEQMDIPYDDYKISYPSEMERLVDIFSIHKDKLLGEFCKCNRNFLYVDTECGYCGHFHGLNRDTTPQTSDQFVVSAGVPFVVENNFARTDKYRFDIVYPAFNDVDTITLSAFGSSLVNVTYSLKGQYNGRNYWESDAYSGIYKLIWEGTRWEHRINFTGSNLLYYASAGDLDDPTTATWQTSGGISPIGTVQYSPEGTLLSNLETVSWITSADYHKYSFYNYNSSFCENQEEGVINWGDTYTTLSSSISSLEEWYGENQLMEEMLNYELHRGIYNA